MKALFLIFLFIFIFLAPFSYAAEKHAAAILLDVSRSVSPEGFEKIKGNVQELIDQELPSDVLSLYTFGSKLQKIDRNQLKSVRADESYTRFYDAAYDAMQDLTAITADKKTILIFSDGKDTKSVTIPEDIVSLARDQKIVIHCIGIGKANQKLLERIAKLTGGRFFSVKDPDLVSQIKMAIAVQKGSDTAEKPQQKPVQAPVQAQPSAARSSMPPVKESKHISYLWIVILGIVLFAGIGGFVLKRRSHHSRICPDCERPLESYQTICPDCAGGTKILSVSELAADLASEATRNAEPAPPVLLERKQDTQEILSKTYFLVETPALVVTKGNNVGESYLLSKELPVSIGRSRLNEIRPDDGSISAQHCRIIPENGEYVLYDLGSTNGTIVNNIMVNKAVLEEGDTIKVGATTLLFTLQDNRPPN